MAMISLKARWFMIRTGRKFIGKKVASDETKAAKEQNVAEKVKPKADDVHVQSDEEEKAKADFVAYMADLSKATGEKKESQYIKKIKSCEAEVQTLTEKLNKELQVIDLAHETMRDKTKELSDKCKELSDSQVKIVELQRKIDQFRNTSFVMNHMMGNLKKSIDRTMMGFNEVPPVHQDYTFLPHEDDLTNFVYGVVVVEPMTVEVLDSSASENDGESEYEVADVKNEIKQNTVFDELLRRLINLCYVDSGCSRHMTGDKRLLTYFEETNGAYVNFAGAKGGKITVQGKVTNRKIMLDKVNYVELFKHNLMSVSQVCDNGYSVHFTKFEA
ncbi:uncharacterized protein LOC110907040 [Helianthus annuus]|uniref:uncharacterized protein LOC110907040 n=1 Tax=Helianthus annuus TaxID=4232 RepID=UPI000B8EFF1F|nr:uncharacterized protein LOC110907040 [Helianthus annuus]